MADAGRTVFISCPLKNLDTVTKLTDALDRHGIGYWSGPEISAGDSWLGEIRNALRKSSLYLMLVSSDLSDWDWCMFELGFVMSESRATGIRIVPIIMGNQDLPAFLQQFQCIDARSMTPDEVAEKIARILNEDIR